MRSSDRTEARPRPASAGRSRKRLAPGRRCNREERRGSSWSWRKPRDRPRGFAPTVPVKYAGRVEHALRTYLPKPGQQALGNNLGASQHRRQVGRRRDTRPPLYIKVNQVSKVHLDTKLGCRLETGDRGPYKNAQLAADDFTPWISRLERRQTVKHERKHQIVFKPPRLEQFRNGLRVDTASLFRSDDYSVHTLSIGCIDSNRRTYCHPGGRCHVYPARWHRTEVGILAPRLPMAHLQQRR